MKMSNRKAATSLILTLTCILGLSATTNTNSLTGFWRIVKSESNDADRQVTGEGEMQFATNGLLIFKIRDPDGGVTNTQTIVGKYTLIQPDQITLTLNGTTKERYRYLFRGGQLRFEHLEYGVTNTLTRLTNFSLKWKKVRSRMALR